MVSGHRCGTHQQWTPRGLYLRLESMEEDVLCSMLTAEPWLPGSLCRCDSGIKYEVTRVILNFPNTFDLDFLALGTQGFCCLFLESPVYPRLALNVLCAGESNLDRMRAGILGIHSEHGYLELLLLVSRPEGAAVCRLMTSPDDDLSLYRVPSARG